MQGLPLSLRPRAFQFVLGLGLVLFGATVMLGWILHWPRVVKLDTTSQVVVFNAAGMFFVGGSALCVRVLLDRSGQRVQTLLGFALSLLAGLFLAQRFAGLDLGVSWPALHQWLIGPWPRQPGAMNPSTAIAFLCCGLALAFMDRVRSKTGALLIRMLIGIAIGLAILDWVGNIIHIEFLYPWYQNWRMALGSACAMLGLTAGVWLVWRQTDWVRAQPQPAADRKITYFAAGILAALTLVTGAATFALLQSRVEDAFGENRLAMLKSRVAMLEMMVDGKLSASDFITSRPNLQRQLRNLVRGEQMDTSAATAQEILQGFLKLGFSAIAVRDVNGYELLRVGTFVSHPKLGVPLQTASPASLLWVDGQYFMHTEKPILDSTGLLGTAIAEQPVPELSRFMLDANYLGQTGDMGLCVRHGERLRCFPQRLRPEVFEVPLNNAAGEPLPITRALAGEMGIIKTLDYRHQDVLAAFGPVGSLGLGMSMKIDMVELYAPIREPLTGVVVLLLLFVAAGAAAIRFRIAPLASRLLAAERQTHAANIALHENAAALTASEKRFRDTLEHAPIGMAIVSLEGKWIDMNRALCDILGYEKPELEKLTFQDIIYPEDLENDLTYVKQLIKGESRSYQIVNRYIRKTGNCVWVLLTMSVLRGDRERPLCFIAQIQDITERKQAEEEISQLNADLEARAAELSAANAELEAFSYSVAHDLRAPLRQILGFSEILTEEHGRQLCPEARKYLDRIQEGARRMGQLVDDLLKLARVGRQALSLRTMPLDWVVRTALEELEPEGSGGDIEWKIGELPVVACDSGLMKQVFVNLLSNALKFARCRERVVVEVGQASLNGEPVFFVRDNGIGFDMRHAGKLFGVFQRLHGAEDFEGTGVGLATVERIIRKHGGRIWADAEVERGATFFFTIASAPSSKA